MHKSKSIHFIGIGGIGISALARWAISRQKKISGSDSFESELIRELIREGAKISIPHDAGHLNKDTDLVIYTEAIDKTNNPEYLEAKKRGIPTMSYFEALGELSKVKKTIAVAGTHGKTTTTAMLGAGLLAAQKDPLIIVGSKVKAFNGKNIHIGREDWMVAEACEYRRSFLNLHPFGVILLNCEAEHLDYYQNEAKYIQAYIELIQKIPSDGFLVANREDKNVQKIIPHAACRVIDVNKESLKKEEFILKVWGDFNRMNALHALKAAEQMGADSKAVKTGLSQFSGTWRRMEYKGEYKNAMVVDDYGHHPTEIKETLKAIKTHHPQKQLICVFQPHQYSRTHLMASEFKTAFDSADRVLITNIYEARDTEDDRQKINAEKLAEKIKEAHPDAKWTGDLNQTYHILAEIAAPGTLIVTMGAGNIGTLADKLVDKTQNP